MQAEGRPAGSGENQGVWRSKELAQMESQAREVELGSTCLHSPGKTTQEWGGVTFVLGEALGAMRLH